MQRLWGYMLHDLQKHGNSTEVPNGQEYTIFFAMSTANTTMRFAFWNVVLRVYGLQYVGEIVQSFNKCMNGHRSDIKCKLDLPLSRHILSYSHTEYRSFAKTQKSK